MPDTSADLPTPTASEVTVARTEAYSESKVGKLGEIRRQQQILETELMSDIQAMEQAYAAWFGTLDLRDFEVVKDRDGSPDFEYNRNLPDPYQTEDEIEDPDAYHARVRRKATFLCADGSKRNVYITTDEHGIGHPLDYDKEAKRRYVREDYQISKYKLVGFSVSAGEDTAVHFSTDIASHLDKKSILMLYGKKVEGDRVSRLGQEIALSADPKDYKAIGFRVTYGRPQAIKVQTGWLARGDFTKDSIDETQYPKTDALTYAQQELELLKGAKLIRSEDPATTTEIPGSS